MQINYHDLQTETLHNLIEHFILREGTDYGEQEISLDKKKQQILHLLEKGDIVILYSELHESITLITKDELNKK
ncbi:YheU family protein [Psychromonas sp. CD1]|uniref:YheU family protein n=1 Tax=Psychromonas sp. CD1 TaxID=1979839 RepID=UPI000B9AEC09|nr:YheU family protein [Psychromonas sp. CD1]